MQPQRRRLTALEPVSTKSIQSSWQISILLDMCMMTKFSRYTKRLILMYLRVTGKWALLCGKMCPSKSLLSLTVLWQKTHLWVNVDSGRKNKVSSQASDNDGIESEMEQDEDGDTTDEEAEEATPWAVTTGYVKQLYLKWELDTINGLFIALSMRTSIQALNRL